MRPQAVHTVKTQDDCELETRIYRADRFTLSPIDPKPSGRLAFVAHPLGRLGGCWDDRLIHHVSRMLLHAGFDVVQANSRGVGASTGHCSFSLVGH